MRVKVRLRKGLSVYVSIFAGLAFIFMFITRFNFPVEKVLEFLWVCVVLVVALALLAAPVALAIRWWSNRRNPR